MATSRRASGTSRESFQGLRYRGQQEARPRSSQTGGRGAIARARQRLLRGAVASAEIGRFGEVLLAPQGEHEMRHRVFRSLCNYVFMELVDGQDNEAANRQKYRDRRQRNLVLRPRITSHWMARSHGKDGPIAS